MTFLPDMHSYLHQSSLLLQAYPTTRVTTKYSLPRKPKPTSTSKPNQKPSSDTAAASSAGVPSVREKREPAATLTLKTYHAETGICLKYRTDKAQEVGRLLNGLGRLARREIIEMPSSATNATTGTAGEDKMDVDAEATEVEGVLKDGKAPVAAGRSSAEMTQQQNASAGGGGGGGKKKKKGKK